MYNQPSYQVAYANFVMDQHQDTPMTPPNTPPLLGNSSPPNQNNYTQILQAPQQIEAKPFQKPVRSRISFSFLQQAGLESEFKGSAYLYKSRRMEIAKRLGLEEKHVKVWFQNRRMKCKKDIIQNGNKITKPYKSRPIYRPQHGSVKKPTEFSVAAIPMQKTGDSIQKPKMGRDVPLLRKVQEKNAAMHQTSNTLPVHKPMAAQLVKGVTLSPTKDFKPQLIVQIPVANRPAPRSMQLAMMQPMSQIYPASNPGLMQLQKHQNTARVYYPQMQHQQQSNPAQHLQQSQYYLQHELKPLQLKPTLSTLISDKSNIFQNPTLTMNKNDVLSQIPSPIEFKTIDFGDITIKSEGLQDQECSEESVDLDKYLNDLERRVEAQKSGKQEAQQQQQVQQQEQPTTKIPEYNFDFSNCFEQFGSLPNTDEELKKVSYPKMDEGDDFDMKDFIENLDKYVTYPGTAPDLDFDRSPAIGKHGNFAEDVFNNFAPKLEYNTTMDMPLPMVNLSFEDCLDTSSLFSESMLNF